MDALAVGVLTYAREQPNAWSYNLAWAIMLLTTAIVAIVLWRTLGALAGGRFFQAVKPPP